jgi:hypothetical protein
MGKLKEKPKLKYILWQRTESTWHEIRDIMATSRTGAVMSLLAGKQTKGNWAVRLDGVKPT